MEPLLNGNNINKRRRLVLSLAIGLMGITLFVISYITKGDQYWNPPVISVGEPPRDAHPLVQAYDAASCGVCHVSQHRSWSASIHARAFSPGLAGQLPGFTRDEQEACLVCHAPRREQHVEYFARGHAATLDGVDCAACHVRAFTRFGPRDVKNTPHGRVAGLPLFRQSEFCASCHQFGPDGLAFNGKPLENTYEEWKASRFARDGITCQSCHMPGKRHEFRGIHDPEMTRKGITVRAVRERQHIRLTATNVGAGHHLPTYTTPLIRIEISGDNKRREHTIRRELAWDPRQGLREVRDTRLAAGENILLTLDLPPDAPGQVVVTVDPGHDYHARIFPDLLASLGATLSAQAQTMLHSARNTARAQIYELYRLHCEPWGGHDTECVAPP